MNSSQLLTTKTFSKYLTMVSQQLFFLVLLHHSIFTSFASALSFNFTSFDSNTPQISYERAYPAKQAIQLTGEKLNVASLGQATYSESLHLWDKASGNLTDFTTHFSFLIDSRNRSKYGDGLAFFFAPAGTKLNPDITKGGGLALAPDDKLPNSPERPFFALEFDIYNNSWDPGYEHVGIDISSMESVATVKWWSDVRGGRRNEAWINYNSTTHNLTVTFTGFMNNRTVLENLYYEIDLRKYLPEWVTFGFSAATGNASAIHSIYSWDFTSSPIAIATNNTETTNGVSSNGGRKGNGAGVAAGLGIGGFVLLGCLISVGFMLWRRNRRNREDDHVLDEYMDNEFEMGKGPKKFWYNELARATSNFSNDEKLGRGGFGEVYKGFLREINCFVAVKRVSKGSKQGIKEYASEIRVISRLRHRNLVQLIGWCHEKQELLLVYEFMSNRSLDAHLFNENSLLTWGVRYRVAQGLASALLYLHEEWEQCVVHRDIKSSNIMLDSSFNCKLGDFGLARLVDHEKGAQTTVIAGTMGYMAPECVITGRASKESDVYSFGIVLLEIACGRKPIVPIAEEEEVVMVEWVKRLYSTEKLVEATDPKLHGDFDKRQMECLMIVGLWCAHADSKYRPGIRQAIQVLNFEAPLPVLKLEMSMPHYISPPVRKQVSSFSVPINGSGFEETKNFNYSSYSHSTNSSQGTSANYNPANALLHTR